MRPPVLHVIPFLWSGAGGVVTQLCEDQRRHGPVTLVSTSRHEALADWPSYRRRLRRAGVTHHTIDFFHRDATGFWRSTSALADVIRAVRPAVIHAHAGVPSCGAVMARAIAAHRARLIAHMYSWGPGRAEWMNVQDTWGFGQSDRVICSSKDYCDQLVEYGVPSRKLTYLPWGLPLDRLPMRERAAGDTGQPAIGFIGRIEPRKGQRELVEAFAQVRRTYPQASLDLIGPVADAAYASEVTARVQHHGLTDVVRMPGEVPDATAWLRTWDLFVSLSRDEGQGLAVLEAMAVGVPVAARPVAGIADFLTDGRTGLAIPGPGVTTAARVVRQALARPAQRLEIARRARRLVERRYSWVQTLRALDRLYWS
jgi:glycosyltransferase involved in cell wall biosynthesis